MPRRVLVALLLLSLSFFSLSIDDTDDDFSFLDEEDDVSSTPHPHPHPRPSDHGDFDEDDGFDDDDFSDFDESTFSGDNDVDGALSNLEVDEKDIVVLSERNFTDVIEGSKYVLVEFYAPWCGHCQALVPEYTAAATQLKEEAVHDVVLAKIDATEENELAHQYDVQGFPTLLFFIDGEHTPYTGQRTKEAIVTWIKKKTGPGVYNITTTEEAEKILTSESKVVLAYLNSLTGPESYELAAASRLEDDVNFYQTVEPNVAKLFHIDSETKRPALVLLKKDLEQINHFVRLFSKAEISEFVFANKLPLVTIFTRESASLIFESQIKKQLLLFATSNDSDEVLPTFQEGAKLFKGKIIFVYVQLNEETGKPVAEYFGILGDAPQILAYSGNEDARKYMLQGEISLDNIKAFGEGFLEDKLKPFFKSDPIPETNDCDVKIVVGNNFDEVVLDESKDVLLEIYAPWCGHCEALEPTYNKLSRHLRGIESIVIAKMDGTTNEHPRAKADGFPTILLFPAGNKSFDPITVDTDRTVVAFYKFLKKHASIPFKLQKPTSTPKTESFDANDSSDNSEVLKDEL